MIFIPFARPYPEFPRRTSAWSDCYAWYTGHWVQGKIGEKVNTAKIIQNIAKRSGIPTERININDLADLKECTGYLINKVTTYRKVLEELSSVYFFDAVESDGTLKFLQKKN